MTKYQSGEDPDVDDFFEFEPPADPVAAARARWQSEAESVEVTKGPDEDILLPPEVWSVPPDSALLLPKPEDDENYIEPLPEPEDWEAAAADLVQSEMSTVRVPRSAATGPHPAARGVAGTARRSTLASQARGPRRAEAQAR